MLLGGRLGGWATDQPPLFAHKCCLAQAPSACWPCAPSLSGPDQIACVLCGRRGVVGRKSRPFIALHQGRAGALSPSPSFLSCFCSLERGRGKEEAFNWGTWDKQHWAHPCRYPCGGSSGTRHRHQPGSNTKPHSSPTTTSPYPASRSLHPLILILNVIFMLVFIFALISPAFPF